ncbi:hypothetical protein ACGFR8_07890 [Streptomyces brevispora]|uniref:effector-associated constant component EACC1 n=1 Tax=Streptomyces brevispora TaxID=887462 RepID=UPI003720C75D
MDALDLLVAFGGVAAAQAAFRVIVAWLRSRHPSQATVTIGDRRLKLDLSKPSEAERYLMSNSHGEKNR